MNKIELAPKNGDLVILQDAQSGAWEVGRWAKESGSWVQIDGTPLRLFPTHWAPASGDPGGSTWQGLSFPMPLRSQQKAAPKRHRTRFVLAFMAAVMIFVTGYTVYDFDLIGTGTPQKYYRFSGRSGTSQRDRPSRCSRPRSHRRSREDRTSHCA